MWRFIRELVGWVLKRSLCFALPIGLSFGMASLIEFGVQQLGPAPTPPIEFSVRQTGLQTNRPCLEIYQTESYEIFEKLCRIQK